MAPKIGGASSSATAPAVPKLLQSDVYQTLSHLHQRAAYHTALSVLSTRDEPAADEAHDQVAESSASGAAAATARSSVRAAKTLAAKATIRLDVGLKRTSCKGCSTPLLPGLTSHVRIHPSGPHFRVARTECLTCGLARKIPTPPLLGAASASLLRSDVDARKRRGKRQEEQVDVAMAEPTEVTADATQGAKQVETGAAPLESAPASKPTTQRARRKAARLCALAFASAPPGSHKASTSAPRPSRTDRKLKRRLRSFVASGSIVPPSAGDATPLSARLSKAPRKVKARKSRATRKPALPPFFERVQGSGWDKGLPPAPAPSAAKQSCEGESIETRVARALRSMRGNHVVGKGLGQGGSLGRIE